MKNPIQKYKSSFLDIFGWFLGQHQSSIHGFWMGFSMAFGCFFLFKKDSSLKPGALQRLLELMALDAATSSDFLEISDLARSSMPGTPQPSWGSFLWGNGYFLPKESKTLDQLT